MFGRWVRQAQPRFPLWLRQAQPPRKNSQISSTLKPVQSCGGSRAVAEPVEATN